jgi:membrane-bound lytic murein transglycosylase A
MLAQDTGGAIKGGVRADFFWGAGNEAGKQAGAMKQRGKMWVLLPKEWSASK